MRDPVTAIIKSLTIAKINLEKEKLPKDETDHNKISNKTKIKSNQNEDFN